MRPHMVAQLQQQRHCKLCHSRCAVGGDIAHRDALFLGRGGIHHVVAGCQHADIAQLWGKRRKRLGRKRRFIGDYDLGALRAAHDLVASVCKRGAVVYRHTAQRLEALPA